MSTPINPITDDEVNTAASEVQGLTGTALADAMRRILERHTGELVAYREWMTKFGGHWEYYEPDTLPAGDYAKHRQLEPMYAKATP